MLPPLFTELKVDMRRAISAIIASSVVLATLTACDPPMPPEIQVELAEQQFNCETGNSDVALNGNLTDLAFYWESLLLENCADMTVTAVGLADEADIYVNGPFVAEQFCEAFTSMPFAIDASVFSFYSLEVSTLNLDGAAITGIADGSITTWNDPKLQELNPDTVLPAVPLVVYPAATAKQAQAMSGWLERISGSAIDLSAFVNEQRASEVDWMYSMPENSMSLAAFSDSFYNAYAMASIVDQQGNPITPDTLTIASGASQLEAQEQENSLAVNLNPEIAPAPPAGQDEAFPPYQALYSVNAEFCGEDNLHSRAIGRFLVRKDVQGNLLNSTVLNLPEALRISVATFIGKGLPVPAISDEAN